MKLFSRRNEASEKSHANAEVMNCPSDVIALALLLELHCGYSDDDVVLSTARAWAFDGVEPCLHATSLSLATELIGNNSTLERLLQQLSIPSALRMQLAGMGIKELSNLLSGQPICRCESNDPVSDQPAARYQTLGELGRGGRGLVYRVEDLRSGREVALKKPHLRDDGSSESGDDYEARFRMEALTAARLEHPNIVPVYDVGEELDGTPFYTMRMLQGKTLGDLISQHHASRQAIERSYSSDTSLQGRLAEERSKLLSALLDVVKAIGYAHGQGVIHRDINPRNIVVDSHGSGVVLDWGLALSTQAAMERTDIVGTPGYMSPEQARGSTGDERSDIYAIGATLYAILCGRPPNVGSSVLDTIRRTKSGSPTRPSIVVAERSSSSPTYEVPEGLEAICLKCLRQNPGDRYQRVSELQMDLLRFWEGNEEARMRKRRARELAAVAEETLEEYHKALLAEIEEIESVDEPDGGTSPRWYVEHQRRLRPLQRETERLDAKVAAAIQRAAAFDGQDKRVQSVACSYLWGKLEIAERDGETTVAARLLDQLKVFAGDEDAKRLQGDGRVELRIVDEPAECWWYRYASNGSRMYPVPIAANSSSDHEVSELCAPSDRSLCEVKLSHTFNRDLPMGSYLCVLRYDDGHSYRVPVHVSRCEEVTIEFRRPDPVLPDEMVFIPGGKYICGENDSQVTKVGRSVEYLPSFAIARHPVTCAEYIAFLNDLDDEEAKARAPRLNPGGDPIWPLRNGQFLLPTAEWCGANNQDPSEYRLESCATDWEPDWPVMAVSWEDAVAYVAWKSAKEGISYRLPTEYEWEKAARGVDGRVYPWGSEFDPDYTNSIYSFEDGQRVVSIEAFPLDESPYGVRGMGGNCRDWCSDVLKENPRMRLLRGGMWTAAGLLMRPANRVANVTTRISTNVGFRLAMDC